MGSLTRNAAQIDQKDAGERPGYRCLHRQQNSVFLSNYVETCTVFPRLPRPTASPPPTAGRPPQHPAMQEATAHTSGS